MRLQVFGLRHVALILCAAFLLSGCSDDSATSIPISGNSVRPAKLMVAGQENNESFLNYPAVIQSQQLSALSFEVGGVLKELLVVEAQGVKKGEVLAKLDQRDLQAKLKSAQAQYDNANAEYQRAVRLMKEDAISRSVLDQRKSTREVNNAALETAQKALQDSVLVAPYDGNIAKISIKEKQSVQAGSVAIGILGSGGLEAVINLPASILAQAGQRRSPNTDSYIVLDAAPSRQLPAVFTEISLEADTASQTYEMTFSFVAPEGVIVLPGMNASVWFKDPSKATNIDAVSLPLTAITIDGDQKYVWVVNTETLQVNRRNITLEVGVGSTVQVLSGLKQGETIVAAGVAALSEGMQVRPWLRQ